MFFEILGFVSGGAVIGTAWMLLLRHQRWKMLDSIYSGKASRPSANRNALIWPSR